MGSYKLSSSFIYIFPNALIQGWGPKKDKNGRVMFSETDQQSVSQSSWSPFHPVVMDEHDLV